MISEFPFCDNEWPNKYELPPLHKKYPKALPQVVLSGGNDIASRISPFLSMASSTLISSPVPSSLHVAMQEQVSPSIQSMQFCNTTTQIMVALSYHMKQDTSIISILHHIKLATAVCLGCPYQQFKNMTKNQSSHRTLLPHRFMAAPLVKKFLAF